MSAITPSSDLYLLKVPIEIDNTNQLTFANATAQYNYFSSCTKIGEVDFTYQRKDGVIRYPAHIDDIINYNYVMYKNVNYSDKWFYAFIDDMRYVNDSMTEISIKTDVWNTWCFDLEFKQSFVEREHVNDDTFGKHTVSEGLDTGEFIVNGTIQRPLNMFLDSLHNTSAQAIDQTCIVMCASTPLSFDTHLVGNTAHKGFFQGLYFYLVHGYFLVGEDNYVSQVESLRQIIKWYTADDKKDAIYAIFMAPTSAFPSGTFTTPVHLEHDGKHAFYYQLTGPIGGYTNCLLSSYDMHPYSEVINDKRVFKIGNHVIRNNKLLTSPYSYLVASNNAGLEREYHWEDFELKSDPYGTDIEGSFNCYGTVTTTSDIKLVPLDYRNYDKAYEYGIECQKFPACSWISDYYTNWITQNGINVAGSIIGGLSNIASVATGGEGSSGMFSGAAGALSSALGLLQQTTNAAKLPDEMHGNLNSGSINYSTGNTGYTLIPVSIREEKAEIIDSFFDKYGYKVNITKTPNLSGRRNWNYVKTIDCNVHAYAPQEDVNEIKQMFNNGVTLWHNPATFLDYSQNNDII